MNYSRILLINPPVTLEQIYGPYASGAPVLPPLGFCYIAGVLLRLGCDVRLLDCAAEGSTLDDVREAIREFTPHAVGVTSTTVSFHCARRVLSIVKELDPGILTLLGGAHISAVPRETMDECPELDLGVYGEGEATLEQLMKALESGAPLRGIEGVCFRENGRVAVNPPRENARDLDAFPPPARHLLKDLRSYSPNPFRGFNRSVSLISSRGCTFDCSYCDQSVFNRRWRAHSADYVIGEMKQLRRDYGFDFFSFEDDHFLINKSRVVELCEKIIAERLNVGWTCSARANSVTPGVLDLMRRAGCRIIYMGLETGSPRLLGAIDKDITLDEARRGVELCRKHGIQAYGAFMIGAPTETPAEIDQTLAYALSLPLDAISCFIYVPYPATPLRVAALRDGFVSRDWRDYSAHPTRLPFLRRGMTEDYLLSKQREFYRRFYLRPGYAAAHWRDYLNPGALRRAATMLKDYALDGAWGERPGVSADGAGGSTPCQRARLHT